jgi:purine-nucleoside phosphorylase
MGSMSVLCAEGRIHGYEGHSDSSLGIPARILIRAGCRALVITNAAGGVNRDFSVGDLMLITDHINISGRSPLTGPNVENWGPRFPDISKVWSPELRSVFHAVADSRDVTLRQGIYACMSGPQYETPAEVRMLRILGADAVGMSTVPEAIIAAHAGVPALGISVICNMAAGLTRQSLSHKEVMEQGAIAGKVLQSLLEEALPRIGQMLS